MTYCLSIEKYYPDQRVPHAGRYDVAEPLAAGRARHSASTATGAAASTRALYLETVFTQLGSVLVSYVKVFFRVP